MALIVVVAGHLTSAIFKDREKNAEEGKPEDKGKKPFGRMQRTSPEGIVGVLKKFLPPSVVELVQIGLNYLKGPSSTPGHPLSGGMRVPSETNPPAAAGAPPAH
jgi:hypothetical protein